MSPSSARLDVARDLRPLLAARQLFRRRDAVAAAMADVVAARIGARSLLTNGTSVADLRFAQSPAVAALKPITTVNDCESAIIYLHGGGLVFHDVELFRPVLEQIAAVSGRNVLALEYPKAPEHSPQAIVASIEQALAGFEGRMVLAGDSVGALLALHLALDVLAGRVERLVLIYPVLNLDEARLFPAYQRFATGYTLDGDFMQWFRALARAGLPADFDPLTLGAPLMHYLPAVQIESAGCDLLADEALSFAELLAAHGHPVRHHVHSVLPHDFLLYGQRSPSAACAIAQLVLRCFGEAETQLQSRSAPRENHS